MRANGCRTGPALAAARVAAAAQATLAPAERERTSAEPAPHVLPPALLEARRQSTSMPTVSVVIPAMNEERNIGWVLSRLPGSVQEVFLVDGRSQDRTVDAARAVRPDIHVLQQHSRGKGAALATGLAAVTCDIAVMMDADGSMDPVEIPGLVGALVAGADVVKGSRAVAGGGSHDLSWLRRAGNVGLTSVSNHVHRQSWSELCYGYAAFWADVLPVLGVHELARPVPNTERRLVDRPGASRRPVAYGHGFEIEALLFCRAARAGLRVAEVFSFEHERRSGASNLATWRDGCRVLNAVLRERGFRTAASPARRDRPYPLLPELISGAVA